MKLLILLFIVLVLSLFYKSNAQELYQFNLNTRVNIEGQPHFKINYYPGTTNTNYKGDFYPDLETNTNVNVFSFSSTCTISPLTDYRVAGFLTPTLSTTLNPNPTITRNNIALVVPTGVTVTINGNVKIPILLIKGRVILNPAQAAGYQTYKTIIFPGGVLESTPTSSTYNHTFGIYKYYWDDPQVWDPLNTAAFISLGGNVTIRGSVSESVWTGSNSSFTSYGTTFLKSFPFTTFGTPVFKMSGTVVNQNVLYKMDNYYTSLATSPDKYAIDVSFQGGGYIFMRPYNKNIWITGFNNASMVFTGSSTVDIQNSVFYDIGHTTVSPLDDNTLDSNYNILHYGDNIPDRYPITLLHNKVAVNIQNNMFMPDFDYSTNNYKNSAIPRSFIGVKRSFGNIIGNAFALKRSMSGISLLYGTEQFDISLNAFISLYIDTSTVSTFRAYPDIDYLNGGIVTTSPYSTYERNAFEGTFKGGAIQIIPVQGRSTATGLSSDLLLGSYIGQSQDNTIDYKLNNMWNSLVYKENFFAGETEFRVRYSTASQPPLKINLFGGWYIGQRASLTLPPNVANIELFYDSPYIANSLSINDKSKQFLTDTHTGTYNAVNIKNAKAIATYTFFADTFRCKYISIVDSVFSHYTDTTDFIKKYTNQLYFKNVNGTKTNLGNSIPSFFPLFDLSPVGSGSLLSNSQINVSFIPNFDYQNSNGQSISYIVNDVLQSSDPNLFVNDFVINVTSTWKTVNFPLSNGPYNVLVSARSFHSTSTTYSTSGPYFANTYIVDSNAPNFYLGLDLTPDIALPRRALSIFNKQWTKCGWVSSAGKCTTTGALTKLTTVPSSILEATTGTPVTANDELSMLTSYLGNDISSSIPSTVNISLSGNQQYKIYIYSYNPNYNPSSMTVTLPIFTIKVDGKIQEPYSRPITTYSKYQKYGPFFWNNNVATNQVLNIQWATENIKYSIPICGIEIYSSITTPYSIPIDA